MVKKIDETSDYGRKTEFTERVYREIMEYLNGERTSFDISYELKGTDFQKRVWEELTRIPYGETRTYKEIANAIGNANASRAVGMANNKNPLMIIVPCHRVVGANGKLIGYAGGIEMKKELLDMEAKVVMEVVRKH
ncbi:methylated-DNA--[protein]-cysteine S-methyltransferase [Nosocomiicoccus sp. HMSC067E10]|uniref:methylated-DNA--[protein]-cysteine S-methyltransferase n=1 Tax=Nosocomiicoccus sp. HMSC067E10 TaxID=1739271 RepID=UPI000AB045F5|nr:methylated-DNA--[protein]-cysteine S-methyltransferase [Nosocomiicoccus sp. HMSC067E10]